ncbi:MAG: twin-arginine translocation pathway signal protein, partial [Proteobacteria bacterium]|nr:twin-arginine translocation pathway signal protein [Pseudomonadota bacterium]
MDRRQSVKLIAAAGFVSFSGALLADKKQSIGAIIPGEGWVEASGVKGEYDGTPLQFMPKTAPDENPLENDIKKYPRCPYCGMSRNKWNHSRHLVHYDDGLADGTCSIHCAAISLSLNIDRGPKAIYAADFGADGEIKPLVEVDIASYLVGAKLKGTMTANSKMAFASADAAKAAQV